MSGTIFLFVVLHKEIMLNVKLLALHLTFWMSSFGVFLVGFLDIFPWEAKGTSPQMPTFPPKDSRP